MSTTDERDLMSATRTVDLQATASSETASALSRRGFLRGSAFAGIGATAVALEPVDVGALPKA